MNLFKKLIFLIFVTCSSLSQLKAMDFKDIWSSFDSDAIEKQMNINFKEFEKKMTQRMKDLDKQLVEQATKFQKNFFRGETLVEQELKRKKTAIEKELKQKQEEIKVKAKEQARRNWELFLVMAKPLIKSAQYSLVATGKFTRQLIQDKSQALVKLQNLEGESLLGAGCLSAAILGATYKIMNTMNSMNLIRSENYKIIFKAISVIIAAKLIHKMYQIYKYKISQRKIVAPVQVDPAPEVEVQPVPELNQNIEQQYEPIYPNLNQQPYRYVYPDLNEPKPVQVNQNVPQYEPAYPNLNQRLDQEQPRVPTYSESQKASAPEQDLVQDAPPEYDEIFPSAPEQEKIDFLDENNRNCNGLLLN